MWNLVITTYCQHSIRWAISVYHSSKFTGVSPAYIVPRLNLTGEDLPDFRCFFSEAEFSFHLGIFVRSIQREIVFLIFPMLLSAPLVI